MTVGRMIDRAVARPDPRLDGVFARGVRNNERLRTAGATLPLLLSLACAAWGQWSGGPTGPVYYNGGNVGIGTSSPISSLQVQGGAAVGSGTYNTAGSGFSLAVTGWASKTMTNDASLFALLSNDGLASNPLALGVSLVGSTVPTPRFGYLQVNEYGTGNWRTLALNPYGGNVGIGTTNPQTKLAVNGNITARDVMVTNTGWSDYVFRPGYRLRPLREVSAYIRANGHLPDIPSEAEVKENGVSVGEMQAKLLAKVEELTLHMIEAEDRNHRLERQNRELRDRIARLEQAAASGARPAAAK